MDDYFSAQTMVEAKFQLDGIDQDFEGYHRPDHHWNGWACPYFTEEVARRVCEACPGDGWPVSGGVDLTATHGIFIMADDPERVAAFVGDPGDLDLDGLWEAGYWWLSKVDVPGFDEPLYTSDGICWSEAL